MIGTLELEVRPLRLAYLVDPQSKKQIKEAIKLSSTLWGGTYSPIIPILKRVPKNWRESMLAPLSPQKMVLGYIDAFDPDIKLMTFYNKKIGGLLLLKS